MHLLGAYGKNRISMMRFITWTGIARVTKCIGRIWPLLTVSVVTSRLSLFILSIGTGYLALFIGTTQSTFRKYLAFTWVRPSEVNTCSDQSMSSIRPIWLTTEQLIQIQNVLFHGDLARFFVAFHTPTNLRRIKGHRPISTCLICSCIGLHHKQAHQQNSNKINYSFHDPSKTQTA